MVLTIVFLSWLSSLRETRQWSHIQERVLKVLGIEVSSLSWWLMLMCRGSLDEGPIRSSDKAFLDRLEELSSQTKLVVWDTWIEMLATGEFASIFEDHERRLADIEGRYFRFLDHRLVDSLMEIRWNLIGLSVDSRALKQIYEAKKEYAVKLLKENIDGYAECLQRIFKEVYKMHKVGLNISTEQKLLQTEKE
ncbi:hypothetical protein MUP77_18615 [Candidatus Bathyarchaeota archaeon]|nr:hypothetical protein [Candidatus Bathyarchaeota archaeon]